MKNALRIFITSSVGFEKILLKEIERTGKTNKASLGKGGVWAEVASFSDVIYLNYALHTANRVLVELISVDNPGKREIYESMYAHNWGLFFRNNETFSIEVPFSAHSDFTNTLFAAQFMKDAICDSLKKENGTRPSIDIRDPQIRLQAFLTESKFCFYFDSSNTPLFKRGYRTDIHHTAPLKETLAASLLFATGFKPESDILIDPCAGSGTFVIEALLLQHKIAPGLLRKKFGFLLHPLYSIDEDLLIKQELRAIAEKSVDAEGLRISYPIAVEQDREMYRAILQSLTRIGILDKAHVLHALFQQIDSLKAAALNQNLAPTFLITNPPYGVRMYSHREHLEDLYEDLGRSAKELLPQGGRAAFLIPRESELQKRIGLRPTTRFAVFQGGLDCTCAIYDIFPKKEIKC